MLIRSNQPIVLLLVLCLTRTEVLGARRRCDDLSSLHNELETLKEENQLLQGEVTSLRHTIQGLGESLQGISHMVAKIFPEDCSQARARGSLSAVAMVSPPGLQPREVACDQQTDGGGWTVVLTRRPTTTTPSRFHSRHDPRTTTRLNFNASWAEYKKGFGDPRGEYWIGNEVLHVLTQDVPHQLHVLLTNSEGNTASATWEYFRVGSEEEKYKLSVSEYRTNSTAGDGLGSHNNHKFSTHDSENDIHPHDHCAQQYGGGWWFFQCHDSFLTGQPLRPGQEGFQGIVWSPWQKFRSLKAVVMMIRPRTRPCRLEQVCNML